MNFFNLNDALAEAKLKQHTFLKHGNVDFQRSNQKRPPSFVTLHFATIDETVRCDSDMDPKSKDGGKATVMLHACRKSEHHSSEDIKCDHE